MPIAGRTREAYGSHGGGVVGGYGPSMQGGTRDSLARRWEGLSAPVQFGLALPVCVLALWWAHVAFLNQPIGRGLVYGIFWGLLLDALLVYATANEARRRR